MEDNNAINEQHNVVDYEKAFNQLQQEFAKLDKYAQGLYNRVQELERTWLLQRATFLLEIVKCGKFDSDTTIKAIDELTAFLFPQAEEQEEINNNEKE